MKNNQGGFKFKRTAKIPSPGFKSGGTVQHPPHERCETYVYVCVDSVSDMYCTVLRCINICCVNKNY